MSTNDIDRLARKIANIVLEGLNASSPPKSGLENRYLTTKQVADLTGIKKVTLERYRALRCGPPYLKAGANVRYLEADVRSWMEANPIATHPQIGNNADSRRRAR